MRKFFIIITAILLLLTSCGSRKVKNTKIENTDETKTKEVVKESAKITTKTDTKIVAEIEDLEIVPIDNTKPVTINGNTYTNARIKTVKAKVNTNVIEDKTESKNNLITTEENKDVKEVTKVKETEKTDNSGLMLIGISLAVIVVYLLAKFK
jgi:preprotein translocase subunit SecF